MFKSKNSRFKKRSFTLLEVLIAFLLITIAMVPLLAPYPFIFQRERLTIQEIELDRLASILFVELLEKIYKKEVDLSTVKENTLQPIEKKLNYPYTARYNISPGEVKIEFTPIGGEAATFSYHFVLPKVV